MERKSEDFVRSLMTDFAERTGLTGGGAPKRYLWTDAFAVCNFLELFRRTGDPKWQDLALRLVDQVHHVLGRRREDDPRSGWISGLNEEEGERHPTRGGLRIGKERKERAPGERQDETLEWERDGQYYHYLTKWMHALCRVTRVTGDPVYGRWAAELAQTAHDRFVYLPSSGGRKRMYWKMSIDLSRPLVASMGHHDPLDGLITYNEIQLAPREGSIDLESEIEDMSRICEGKNWATDDPLGVGGLLTDICRVSQMMAEGDFAQKDLLGDLLDYARLGVEAFAKTPSLDMPPDYRLAFRELGLATGLKAVKEITTQMESHPDRFDDEDEQRAKRLGSLTPPGEKIEDFWSREVNRNSESWKAHRDINEVMLATTIAPESFLSI